MSNDLIKEITSSGGTVFCPFGLLKSLATFATNLLIEIPAEAVSPVSSLILSLIALAIKLALCIPFLFTVTSI